MQLAPRSDSTGQVLQTKPRKFLVAGAAMVGAGLIAVHPVVPAPAEVQQRAVQLTSGIGDVLGDYEDVFNQSGANLQTLGGQAGVAISGLLQQIGANLSGEGSLISTALSGTQTALQSSLSGGFYGNDDGYVFGLFEGSLTDPSNGVTESGSTLQEILTALEQGNLFSAYSYYDTWSLESLQHITKPLLSPILSTSKSGATPTPTLPGEFLQTLTNVTETFLSYSELQSIIKALWSPEIGLAFGFFGDLDTIGGDLSSGNLGAALTDVLKAPADLLGDLLNGYIPNNGFTSSGEAFTGLLNSGSLLQDLLVTWPNELAQALGASTTPGAAAAVNVGSAAVELTALLGAQGINGLVSGLGGNLAGIVPGAVTGIVPGAVTGIVGAVLGAL